MGQRANLIVVENGDYTLRYDHWIANRLDNVLFWGAEFALKYFEAQERVDENGWLDDVWAEGGAILDLDEKHLLWYGGEDVMHELPLRRVYLEQQAKVWRGWRVEWAHRGIVDLAEYVNVPKEKVLSDKKYLDSAAKIKLLTEKSWIETLGSVRFADGETRMFPLRSEPEDYLRCGVDLIEQCRAAIGLKVIVWNEWSDTEDDFPRGGFHLDEKNNILEFWEARDCPNTVSELKEFWTDWDVVWHQDNYEFQLERLNGKVVLPEIDKCKLIAGLCGQLLREDGNYGVESFSKVKETLESEGKNVQINDWALKSCAVKNPLEIKRRIWENLFSA